MKVDSLAQRIAACRYFCCVELLFGPADKRQMSLKRGNGILKVVYENWPARLPLLIGL